MPLSNRMKRNGLHVTPSAATKLEAARPESYAPCYTYIRVDSVCLSSLDYVMIIT